MKFLIPTLGLVLAIGPALHAQQYNNVWVKFEKSPSSLVSSPISDFDTETDVAWDDLDKNGWVDVVVVRKEPFTSSGTRRNILLMNYSGVLTNMTSTLAVASDVLGDNGFGTPTNDRDVQIVDVDGDTWLDVVTATTISDGEPKHIGHPRVYMNLGEDGGGNWLGLEYQDARIPQLLHYGTGLPENPRFCSVTFGDVTGDGAPDLYFGDYDSSEVGAQQPPNKDLNDRLLINDGFGFFTDESQTRMSAQMLLSAFGMAVEIEDMNLDGYNDIVKDTALNAPQYVAISYNNLMDISVEGMFNNFDNGDVGSGAPYHIDVGDLNADGRPDIITTDDALDRYRFNTGVDALGRATFSGGSGGHLYDFLFGGDDGFGSNNLIVDLDNDGWADTLHTDLDVDLEGLGRRLHLYHNTGSEVGALPGDIITLREEREHPNAAGPIWLGVKGMVQGDLTNTHDVAVFDIDNDGWNDMLVSRMAGTDVWLNVPPVCQTDLGFAGPGDLSLSVCGEELTIESGQASLEVTGAGPGGIVFLLVGLVNDPTPLLGGTLVPNPILLIVPVPADGDGELNLKVDGSGGPANNIYLQAVTDDGGWEFSNALELVIGS